MSIEENKAIVRRFYQFGATGEQDDLLLAPDIAYHGPPSIGDFQGRDAFKQMLTVFRSAFPGYQTTVDDLIAEGDRVAALHTHSGTHRGEFLGIPPTGKSATTQGIEIFRVHNGQIVEFWHMDDIMSLVQALGGIPSPGQP